MSMLPFITKMVIIYVIDSLKGKLLYKILKEQALHWYTNLPKFYVTNYHGLSRKLINHFLTRKHRNISTNNFFNVRQSHIESLQVYFTCFNKAPIKVVNPNRVMFMGVFHKGLKDRHFNESLS